MGAVVIDIGGGTTDLAVFIEGTVWHTAVIPVGGNHITNDITYVTHIPYDTAEAVKVQYGHALSKAVDPLETLLIEPFGEGMPTEFSRRELSMIIEARIEDVFERVLQEIKRSGYDGLLRAGAVITGGSSQLPGMREVAMRVFNFPVRLAKPERITGMADALRNPSYSTSVGLLRLGLEMDGFAPHHPGNGGSIAPPAKKWGQMIGGLLRRLLPDDQ
jgi:cell division protein FtsA